MDQGLIRLCGWNVVCIVAHALAMAGPTERRTEIHHKHPILLIRHLPDLRDPPEPLVLIKIIRNLYLLLLVLDLLICFLI
jgi:hypothetical protein